MKSERGPPCRILFVCKSAHRATQLAGRPSSHLHHGQDGERCVFARVRAQLRRSLEALRQGIVRPLCMQSFRVSGMLGWSCIGWRCRAWPVLAIQAVYDFRSGIFLQPAFRESCGVLGFCGERVGGVFRVSLRRYSVVHGYEQ